MKKSNSEILKSELYGVYQDLLKYIENNLPRIEDPDEFIDKSSIDDILDMWLRWQGICGYTSTILAIFYTLIKKGEE